VWGCEPLDGARTVLVTIAGELDRDTAPGLRNHLEWLLAGECRRIILDAAAVEFADHGALDLLEAVGERASARGCQLVVTSPGPALGRLLELVGLPRGVELEAW
jgi:anti-anti-sigma factor